MKRYYIDININIIKICKKYLIWFNINKLNITIANYSENMSKCFVSGSVIRCGVGDS